MKPYIVFTALTIAFLTAVIFSGDAGRYDHDIVLMKTMAEEAACGAALCIDWEEYAKGRICFDGAESQRFIKEYIESSAKGLKNTPEDIAYEVEYEDDNMGYSSENLKCLPCVRVSLTAKIQDAFALHLIQVTSITSNAKYEYVY